MNLPTFNRVLNSRLQSAAKVLKIFENKGESI